MKAWKRCLFWWNHPNDSLPLQLQGSILRWHWRCRWSTSVVCRFIPFIVVWRLCSLVLAVLRGGTVCCFWHNCVYGFRVPFDVDASQVVTTTLGTDRWSRRGSVTRLENPAIINCTVQKMWLSPSVGFLSVVFLFFGGIGSEQAILIKVILMVQWTGIPG